MNSKTLREQRAVLISEAQALIPQDTKLFTSELRTKVEAMFADAKGMDSILASLETEERSALEQRGQKMQLPNVGEHTNSADNRTSEIRSSFRSYLKTGAVETRDLTVAADGVFIPTFVAQPVVARKYAGCILDCVGKLTTETAAPIKVPYWNDIANSFVLNSAGITTTDPVITSGPTLGIDDYRFNPLLIDTSLIQDAAFDIETAVTDAIALRYQRDMSKFITLGNGSNIGGLTAIVAGVQSGTTLLTAYNDFVNLFASLDPAYSSDACFCMNLATLGAVLKIVDSNLRPLFLPYSDGGASGFAGTILGFPVKLNQYLPNVGVGTVAIQFGDFKSGYTFRTLTSGISVLRLAERYAELKKVGYVAFTRVGGAVLSAGTPPIVSLTGK